jgi:hypothetical protein
MTTAVSHLYMSSSPNHRRTSLQLEGGREKDESGNAAATGTDMLYRK